MHQVVSIGQDIVIKAQGLPAKLVLNWFKAGYLQSF